MFPSTIRDSTWTSSWSFCPNAVYTDEGFDSLQKVNEERSSGTPKIAICWETVGGWRQYNSAFRCYFCAVTSAPLRTHRSNNVCPSCLVMNWLPPRTLRISILFATGKKFIAWGQLPRCDRNLFLPFWRVNGTVIILLMEKLPCEDEWSAPVC